MNYYFPHSRIANISDPKCIEFVNYVDSLNETLSNVEITALEQLCRDFRSAGVFTKSANNINSPAQRVENFFGCYPIIGNSKLVKSLNLNNPSRTDNRLDFPTSEWDYSGYGVKANGDAAIENIKVNFDLSGNANSNEVAGNHGSDEIFIYSVLSDETSNPVSSVVYYDFIRIFNTIARLWVASRTNGWYFRNQIRSTWEYERSNGNAKGVYGYSTNTLSDGTIRNFAIYKKNKYPNGTTNTGVQKFQMGLNSNNRYGTIVNFRSHKKYVITPSVLGGQTNLDTDENIEKVCNAVENFDASLGRKTY